MLLLDESLAEHGGSAGLRDEGLLESALARARNLAAYEKCDVADLAAAHGVGLARNHPFVDGNKRTAILSTGIFLGMNGMRLEASQKELVRFTLNMAVGKVSNSAAIDWLKTHCTSSP